MYKLTSFLSILGMGLAAYLLYEFAVRSPGSLCYINETVNCQAATTGSLSALLGIPVALYGLSGYFVILIAALKKRKRVVFGTSLFGLVFCLRITFVEVFQLGVICPVCLACQIDMVILFILSVFMVFPSFFSRLKSFS